jgi:N-acetylneuraminic acid mutarotase
MKRLLAMVPSFLLVVPAIAGGCGNGVAGTNGGTGGTGSSTTSIPGTGGVLGSGGTRTSGSSGATACAGDISASGSLGLRATPPVIAPGQSCTLSWDSHTTTSLTIEPGIGSVLGKTSQVVSPDRTTTYTLTSDLLQDTVTVVVTQKAVVRTGSLTTARSGHSATLLADGRVLVAGGASAGQALGSAELFDPATGVFTAVGAMQMVRGGHTATLLANGKVLIVGGVSAELYDPTDRSFAAAGNPQVAREEHTATLLGSGQVLVAGGVSGTSALTSAEIYDPATNKFTATGNLTIGRYQHAATLLPGGKVVLLGGFVFQTDTGNYDGLQSAEIYDPATGTFAATASMGRKRVAPVTMLLGDGTVLVGGGWHGFEGYFGSNLLEIYDPAAGTFAATGNMAVNRALFTMTQLDDGSVFMAGGLQHNNGSADRYLANAEIYDPSTRTSAVAACLPQALVAHTVTALLDSRVLLAGGRSGADSTSALADAYLYQ